MTLRIRLTLVRFHHRSACCSAGKKAVGVPIFGRSYGNSGPRGNVYICPPPTEYYHPVYCDSYDTGDISVEITADGTMGETTLVEAGGCIPIPRGSEGGGKGDGLFYGGW